VTWVLIIIMTFGTTPAAVEFNSEAACQAAQVTVQKTLTRLAFSKMESDPTVNRTGEAICVAKGEALL
jgi:hypothetical protein